MRKAKIFIKFFWSPILLIIIATICWFYIPDNISNFRSGLVASILGVGISIFTAESYKKLTEHKRVKKTLGFLKLITIPYLKSQSKDVADTMKLYLDICSLSQAHTFLLLAANFDSVSMGFDKSWLHLIYSQGFVDAINSDDHFYKISNTVLEILLFTKVLTAQSVNAKHLLANDLTKLSDEEMDFFLLRTKQIRNELNENAQKLQKYTDKLNDEVDRFFSQNAVKYEEFER